jgi:hypothetical protein
MRQLWIGYAVAATALVAATIVRCLRSVRDKKSGAVAPPQKLRGHGGVLLVGSPAADQREICNAKRRLVDAGYEVHVSVACGRSSADEFGDDVARLLLRDTVAVMARWKGWRQPRIGVLLANALTLPVIDAETLEPLSMRARRMHVEIPDLLDFPDPTENVLSVDAAQARG